MPRYYFHYRNGDLFKDDQGEELPDLDAARRHARRVAVELAQGGEPQSASVVVAEADQTLFVVELFSERPAQD
jgi:hypothetical protein